jgi:mono/diheme cytochrome c family protein
MLTVHPATPVIQLTVVIGLACLATATQPAAAASGWYTQAQVSQGRQLYKSQCAQCHRPDLKGAQGPALAGPAFLAKWGNKPLSDLYTLEQKTMPPVNPGSVPPDQLWAITAFILQQNGFAPGDSPLGPAAADRPLKKQ